MNTTVAWDACEPSVLAIVDFKWLMAGEGHRIDVGRLLHDAPYARACLSVAAGSPLPQLRRAAQRLEQALPAAMALVGGGDPAGLPATGRG